MATCYIRDGVEMGRKFFHATEKWKQILGARKNLLNIIYILKWATRCWCAGAGGLQNRLNESENIP